MADEPQPDAPEQGPPEEPSDARRSRARRIVFFSVSAAFVVAVVALFRAVLTPFVLAAVVAYVLYPAAKAAERVRIRGKPFPRWIAVIVIYLLLLGTLTGLGVAVAPRMRVELARLGRELPTTIEGLKRDAQPTVNAWARQLQQLFPGDGGEPGGGRQHPAEQAQARVTPRADGGYDVAVGPGGLDVQDLGDGRWRVAPPSPHEDPSGAEAPALGELVERALAMGEGQAAAALDLLRRTVTDVVRGIFTFFLTLMLAAYVIISWDRIYAFFRGLVAPARRDSFDSLMRRLDRGLSGVVRGQLVICIVNGVLSGIGFYIADLKYWPVLTLLATVFSIIPIFGAILSSVPACAVALGHGIGTFFFTLIWIIGIHQIEANILNPKIMGDAAKIHPVLIVFSLLAGEWAYGILGALLAVPVLSVCQSLFLHYKAVVLDGQPVPRLSSPPDEPPR